MLNFTLTLIAIPLNLIGYLLKHGTKIRNKLIPVIIIAISCIVFFGIGRLLGNNTVDSVMKYGLVRGIGTAFVAMGGWDFFHGIKTVMQDVMAQAFRLITFDKEGTMDKLKKWHRALLSNILTVAIVSLITFVVGYANTRMGSNTISASIDMTVLAIVFVSSGILTLDLITKIANKSKELNTQYGICFGFAITAIGSFIMAYVATTWTITFMSFGVFVISFGLALFLVRYSYIPSLETKEQATQRIMKERFAEYKDLSDEEIALRMRKDVHYFFKKKVWEAELDTSNPIFLDSENNALSVEALTSLDSDKYKTIIDKATAEFAAIIKTREVK